MTVTAIGGLGGATIPQLPVNSNPGTAAVTIAATGGKIAMVGRFAHSNRANTSPITKIRFLPGALTSAGGSGLTLSLQDVSLTTSPLQPDGTQDQTVAILISAMTANTWFTSAALSANRTVAVGDLLAVVWEYDGGGRLGADSFAVTCMGAGLTFSLPSTMLQTAGTWAMPGTAPVPNVIFECADGTLGTLDNAINFNSFNNLAYNLNTAAQDETALAFTLPGPVTVDGAWLVEAAGTTADFTVVLYDGTTPMTSGTVTQDANALTGTGGRLLFVQFPAAIALAGNHQYRLALVPTTVNSVTNAYITVNSAAEWDTMPGGQAFYWSARVNAGAWTDTLNRRPIYGIRIAGIDDGGGGGGGASMLQLGGAVSMGVN